MKYEWKKSEKDLYGPKTVARRIEVPKQKYIMISGKGNPNDQDFSNRVAVLYALAYGVKMAYKSLTRDSDIEIQDFVVYPLEGIWSQKKDAELIKENLEYTIMIRQPDFITKEMVDAALEKVKKKKSNVLLEEVFFDSMCDGKCVDILHVGSFDDEPESFEKMDAFVSKNGLTRSKNWHREIYLNNANRTLKNRLKTILRYPIEDNEV